MNETLGRRILIIEDDPNTQTNLRDILELDGYQVEVASTIEQAFSNREWPLLFAIVLDRRLPDGTADSMLPKLRQLAPKAAVVVVTGYADLDGAIKVIRHGIADFIPKPVNADMLRASLARIAHLKEVEERSEQAERLAALGQMLASVAHESRNALQRIQISVELLEQSLQDVPEGLEELAKIEKAAGSLHALLQELRNFVGPIHLECYVCSLPEAWRNAWRALEGERRGSSIEFDEECSNSHLPCNLDQLTCNIDQRRLEQVFRNLFENSLAACGDSGKIQLSCSREDRDGQQMVSLIVRDTGPGLDEEQALNVFKPFFTTKPKGTGLGMAIAKRIIEAHGGQIAVAQDLRPGAAFRIQLPRGTDSSAL